jgi:hypothetical protein
LRLTPVSLPRRIAVDRDTQFADIQEGYFLPKKLAPNKKSCIFAAQQGTLELKRI